MKRWSLRWKIAGYAAMLGIVATITGACTTWLLMHYWELRAFDRQLQADAQEIFQELATLKPQGTIGDNEAVTEKLASLGLRNRWINITSNNGQMVYRSPNADALFSGDAAKGTHTRKFNQATVRVTTVRRGDVTVQVGADVAGVSQIGRDIIFGMFGAIPTVLLVVAIGGRWVAQRALAPIERITEAASRITAKNLHRRLPVPATNDEIADLVSVVNGTFERLQRSFEQSIRFSADASHYLKTPLAVLRVAIEEILTDPTTPAQQQERAAALLHQVHQLTSISENLLLLARADAGRLDLRPEKFNLREVLDGACDDARAMAEPSDITVRTEIPPELPLVADRSSIALIIQNLVENAVKYNERGGAISISASSANGAVEVRILNNGAGIPTDRAPHIFERFYRARSDARTDGAGLGLSVACELAKANGGDLELVNSNRESTEFRLTLPRT